MTNIAICGASGKMGHFIADVIASREDCKTVCGIDKFGEKYSDFDIVRTPSEMPEKPEDTEQAPGRRGRGSFGGEEQQTSPNGD